MIEYPYGCPNYWNDATAVFICPPGQAGQGDPINFYNPRWYDRGLYDIDNRDFGFSFQGFPSSYWAT